MAHPFSTATPRKKLYGYDSERYWEKTVVLVKRFRPALAPERGKESSVRLAYRQTLELITN